VLDLSRGEWQSGHKERNSASTFMTTSRSNEWPHFTVTGSWKGFLKTGQHKESGMGILDMNLQQVEYSIFYKKIEIGSFHS
jgi:hypothetical protein